MKPLPTDVSAVGSGVYQRYLASVLNATGAVGAALLIDDHDGTASEPLLVHAGQTDAMGDFADVESAAATLTAKEPADANSAALAFFPGTTPNLAVLRVCVKPERGGLLAAPPPRERRARRSPGAASAQPPCVWFALSFPDTDAPSALEELENVDPRAPRDRLSWMAHTLILVAGLLWDSYQVARMLRDPTSRLPGRAEFQERLKTAFRKASETDHSLGLVLINPDDFGAVNERLGREHGDAAVAEVATLLRSSLRQDEQIFRYGGAVFAVLIPSADSAAVEIVARKVRHALSGAYLDGAVRLMFSVGAAVYEGGASDDPLQDELALLRRADHALNLAKRAGGGCSVLWSPEDGEVSGGGVDRLSGIFTANTEKDYRNMLLLWDTVAVLSSSAHKPQIVREFVQRINVSIKPRRAAVLEQADNGEFREISGIQAGNLDGGRKLLLDAPLKKLLQQAQAGSKPASRQFKDRDETTAKTVAFVGHAIPIHAGDKCLACLYLDGPTASFSLDSSDLVFLGALAGQLGLALDRVDLADRVRRETEVQSKRLKAEVRDLRQVVHSAKLVYNSRQMNMVLDTLRAVAATDVTILIDGESGTGKEMLARAVHDLSERRDKPLVVVDCGTIAPNLIDAELFGHTKGAYTGAHGSSPGRIAQAEGGTLFLDEIGELPLDVQAKLLRFVQEKEINPVGATSSRRVDTRIVAATNRDLSREAAEGRFREDLYYRLKVVTVTSPPLRDRRDDILPLARHFLDKFALQYEKPVRRFAPEAEQYLQEYDWPGNVRELQNSVLRAVVLSTDEAIPAEVLQVQEERPIPRAGYAAGPEKVATEAGEATREVIAASSGPVAPRGFGDPWLGLQDELVSQLEIALTNQDLSAPPLGRWLTEDLVRAADRHTSGNARRASAELGIAETTYRRQLEKVRRAESQGLLRRTADWDRMAGVMSYLVESLAGDREDNVVERAKLMLLAEVDRRILSKDSQGAALMGVTVPTYRRWRDDIPRKREEEAA